MELDAGFLAGIDSEFVVHRARLPRVTPFPTWNGVLACSGDGRLVSLLNENGQVYVLNLHPLQSSSESLRVHQILDSDSLHGNHMSICQAWSRLGDSLFVARDRVLTVYRLDNDDGKLHVSFQISLRFAAMALDVIEQDDSLLVVIGSVAGMVVYSVNGSNAQHLSSQMDDISVSILKFSPDGHFLAMGTFDGRVIVLSRNGQDLSDMGSSASFTKVLAAPRVTSITFSAASDKIIVTTRKGNVYVLTKTEKGSSTPQWGADNHFEALVANPKGGAASQTLSCWWGATPVFVIAGRASSDSLEMYDVRSRTLLHTLTFASGTCDKPLEQGASDLHLMAVVCVNATPPSPPRLMTIDSEARLSLLSWPFVQHACPHA